MKDTAPDNYSHLLAGVEYTGAKEQIGKIVFEAKQKLKDVLGEVEFTGPHPQLEGIGNLFEQVEILACKFQFGRLIKKEEEERAAVSPDEQTTAPKIATEDPIVE